MGLLVLYELESRKNVRLPDISADHGTLWYEMAPVDIIYR